MNDLELKKKAESILFSAGKRLSIPEIARLCGNKNIDEIQAALEELKEYYTKQESSLIIDNANDEWRITVKDRYMPYACKITTKTELSKTLMETLAVVAYKSPVLQSNVIKIRTNKAYDHLAQLEKYGYIARTKHGRTKLIKLAQKFFDYFDVPPEAIRQKFAKIMEMEKTVAETEKEKKEVEQKIRLMQENSKKEEVEFKKEQTAELKKVSEDIESQPKIPLQVYDIKAEEVPILRYPEGTNVEIEKWGDLEIYRLVEEEKEEEKAKKNKKSRKKKDIPSEKKEKKSKATIKKKTKEKEKAKAISETDIEETFKKAKPLFGKEIPEKIQKKIDEKVAELLNSNKHGSVEIRKDMEEKQEEEAVEELPEEEAVEEPTEEETSE